MLKNKASKSFEIKLANGKEDSFDTGYSVWTFYERMSSPSSPRNYEYIVPNLVKLEETQLNIEAAKNKKKEK